jgi:hypothetical protein
VVELAGVVETGAHELLLWLLETGAVLQKIVVDFGGYKDSALGPLGSKLVGK